MEELKTPVSLELEENLRFERVEWRAARVTWFALLAVIAATLAGLFGGGPLSHATAGPASAPLRVEYPRFGRYGASLRFTVHARATPDGAIRLRLSRSLLRSFRIQTVTPEPARSSIVAGGVEYVFDASPAAADALIVLEVQSTRRGLIRGALSSGGLSVALTQFIYP